MSSVHLVRTYAGGARCLVVMEMLAADGEDDEVEAWEDREEMLAARVVVVRLPAELGVLASETEAAGGGWDFVAQTVVSAGVLDVPTTLAPVECTSEAATLAEGTCSGVSWAEGSAYESTLLSVTTS